MAMSPGLLSTSTLLPLPPRTEAVANSSTLYILTNMHLYTAGIEGQTYTKDDKGVVTRIDHGPEPTDKAEKEAFRIKT